MEGEDLAYRPVSTDALPLEAADTRAQKEKAQGIQEDHLPVC